MDIGNAVCDDIEQRIRKGEKEYGERLRPHNGRDALQDAYEECLDMAMYLKQAIIEAATKNTSPNTSEPVDKAPTQIKPTCDNCGMHPKYCQSKKNAICKYFKPA